MWKNASTIDGFLHSESRWAYWRFAADYLVFTCIERYLVGADGLNFRGFGGASELDDVRKTCPTAVSKSDVSVNRSIPPVRDDGVNLKFSRQGSGGKCSADFFDACKSSVVEKIPHRVLDRKSVV